MEYNKMIKLTQITYLKIWSSSVSCILFLLENAGLVNELFEDSIEFLGVKLNAWKITRAWGHYVFAIWLMMTIASIFKRHIVAWAVSLHCRVFIHKDSWQMKLKLLAIFEGCDYR